MTHPSLVWIRNDLRLHDNPALSAASKSGNPVIICFIWSEDEQEPYPLGGASRAWLHDSLIEFTKSLKNRLILRKGKYLPILEELIRETSAKSVYWNRRYEPHLIAQDQEIKNTLTLAGINVETFSGNLLFEPWEVATKAGKPFRLFTPFYKHVREMEPNLPIDAPPKLNYYSGNITTETIDQLSLFTKNPPLDVWQPGEEGAMKALDHFVKGPLKHYRLGRDFPAENATSRLSPHLHFGEISIRTLLQRVSGEDAAWYFRELCWREFAAHLLYHFPMSPNEPLRKEFTHFPWRRDPGQLSAWQHGMTGYPIVDAGMRELLATGWMHNRVRMIVGSFLVKHLLLSWLDGEQWFWDKLFDADLANNTLGWQWVAGCGADAAPYFRIFNPLLQAEKFDPEGTYIKQWVPEMRNVAIQAIHNPSKIEVKNYPQPIVDLDFGRSRALEAFQEMKNGR